MKKLYKLGATFISKEFSFSYSFVRYGILNIPALHKYENFYLF